MPRDESDSSTTSASSAAPSPAQSLQTPGSPAGTVDDHQILDHLAEGVILTDATGSITYLNEAARLIHGVAELNVPVSDYSTAYHLLTLDRLPYPPEDLPLARAVLHSESVTDALWRIRRPDGDEVIARGSARPITTAEGVQTGAVLTFRDVTRQVELEAAQQFLSEASGILGSSLEYELTLVRLAELAVPRLADWCAIDLTEESGGAVTLARAATAHYDPAKLALAQELSQNYPPDPELAAGPYKVLATGQPTRINGITDSEVRDAATSEGHYNILAGLGLKAYMCVPLKARGRILGTLTLVQAESGRHCTEGDLELALALADRAGIAVDNARLFRRAQAENAERVATELSLRESEQRLETTLRSIGDAVIATDENGCVTLMNAVAETLTGWNEQEARGQPCHSVFRIINEFTREEVESPVARVIRDGVVVGLANHTLLISRQGVERPIDDSGAPVFGPDGQLAGVALVFRDVTERRRTEQALQQQAGLLDLTAEAVLVHEEGDRILYWNTGAEKQYGWSRREAIGAPAHELLQTRFPVSYELIKAALESDGYWEGELTHTRRDGSQILVSSRWAMQRDADGRAVAVLEINRDITEQRLADIRLSVQHDVSKLLADAGGRTGIGARLTQIVGEKLGWEYAAIWLVDRQKDTVYLDSEWHAETIGESRFLASSRSARLTGGEGLPGRVWASDEPVWISDLHAASALPRASHIAEARLSSAAAVPIRGLGKVVGVLELFAIQLRPEDPLLLQSLLTLCNQIGQFVERTEAEANVRESEARKGAMLDAALDAIVSMNSAGAVVDWNPAAERIFGYSRAEAVGSEMAELIVPQELRAAHRAGLAHYLKTGEGPVLGNRLEIPAVRKDGSRLPVELLIQPLELNGTVMFTGFLRDISERAKAQTALSESEARFRTIVEQSPFSIQVLSTDGVTRMVNPAWEQLWGLRLEQLEGYNLLTDPQLERQGAAAYIRRGFAGEPTAIPPILYDPAETIPGYSAKEDTGRWVEANIYPVRDPEGIIRQIILVHQDVTARIKSAEAQERSSREIALLNERLQRAMMETHHRVKNNLQVIAAMIDMQTLTDASAIPVEDVRSLGGHVRTLAAVHDLLTDAAKNQGEVQNVSAREILQKLIPMLQETSGGRQVTVSLEDANLDVRQATGLALVAAELFANAIKHAHGSVEITLEVRGETANLEVCDDGPGFPRDFRVDELQTTGLGLVDNLTEWDLGGSAAFTNRPEGGARVIISMPIKHQE